MGMRWISHYLGAETRTGAKEKTFIQGCMVVSLLTFPPHPHAGTLLYYTKIISQTPGDYCIKMWWIATLKKPDNLLPFRFPATVVKYGPNFGRENLLGSFKHPLCLKPGWPVLRPPCISASLLLPEFCPWPQPSPLQGLVCHTTQHCSTLPVLLRKA